MKKVLLSIKPIYVEKIFAGEKKYEYRKTRIRDSQVSKALIYQSNNTKMIVGEFEIDEILSGTPTEIWAATHQYGGINERSFFEYFKKRDIAYAYAIKSPIRYAEPLSIRDYGLSCPPMSYCYIHDQHKTL